MIKSVLLICLFVGFLSMLAVDGKNAEWIGFLLIIVLFLFMFNELKNIRISFQDEDVFCSEFMSVSPEKETLQRVVSDRVAEITGQKPLDVESDLEVTENGYSLNSIYVIIAQGSAKEVQDELQRTFSFEGFTVVEREAP